MAAEHASSGAATLAVLADAAVFAPPGALQNDSDAFWAIVDAERASLKRTSSRIGRVKAALSLRSFLRMLRESGMPREQ
ncbi:hypothetical protein [Salinibacterium sp. ZJ454]|uniref:hypothetical protein n=1 Tax=Salinibacterium sp. ZJ454 TaxID=2708339 RepID=UPI00142197D0|nr:hypothetical protein [Salinibacterium sp. ZJ454]